jgi:hypothetical protein
MAFSDRVHQAPASYPPRLNGIIRCPLASFSNSESSRPR